VTESTVIAWFIATLALSARVLGVLLFGTALWSKLRNFDEFASIMARYTRAPVALSKILAFAVIALEAAVVALLIWPDGVVVGAWLAITLLLCFAAAMGAALLRGERDLDCGCMRTALRQRVRWPLLVRNLLVALFFVPLLQPTLTLSGALPVLDGVTSGVVLFVLYLVVGMLVALSDSFADLKRRYS
jgi:hypothetical protein